jgi:hypothetical protein
VSAEAHVRRAQSTRAVELAAALDIALLEYGRRYGNVRFRVSGLRVTEAGVEFTVVPA